MTTTTTTTVTAAPRPAGTDAHELPALTTGDRIAVALGAHLILRAEQHRVRRAEQAARAEHARVAGASTRAAQASDTAFSHRTLAGPRW